MTSAGSSTYSSSRFANQSHWTFARRSGVDFAFANVPSGVRREAPMERPQVEQEVLVHQRPAEVERIDEATDGLDSTDSFVHDAMMGRCGRARWPHRRPRSYASACGETNCRPRRRICRRQHRAGPDTRAVAAGKARRNASRRHPWTGRAAHPRTDLARAAGWRDRRGRADQSRQLLRLPAAPCGHHLGHDRDDPCGGAASADAQRRRRRGGPRGRDRRGSARGERPTPAWTERRSSFDMTRSSSRSAASRISRPSRAWPNTPSGSERLGDAFYLRNRALDVLEEARIEADEERRPNC